MKMLATRQNASLEYNPLPCGKKTEERTNARGAPPRGQSKYRLALYRGRVPRLAMHYAVRLGRFFASRALAVLARVVALLAAVLARVVALLAAVLATVVALVGRLRLALLWYLARLLAPWQKAVPQIPKACAIGRASLFAIFRRRTSNAPRGNRVLMLTISHIDIDPRINKVAKSMAEAGYEIEILSPVAPEEQFREEEVIPGVKYVRVPIACRRLWHYFQEDFRKVGVNRDFDYVHANDLTTLWTAWILARHRGVPLIYDAHEMWSENVSWNGSEWVPMSKMMRFAMHCLEGFLVSMTDIFISVSPSICKAYQQKYRLKRPPILVGNFPDAELLNHDSSTTIPTIRQLCKLGDKEFVTLYFGGVNPLRNIENVIRAHQYLPDDCIFVIRGPAIEYYRKSYEDLASQLGISHRIRYLPPVERHELVPGMVGADCGIVMLKNICKNFYWYYPNKFFEYMLAGLPVAVSDFPDVAAHIEREECGVVFEPESPESIAQAIRELYDDRHEARRMGQRGLSGIRRQYNWGAAKNVLLEEYKQLKKAA